MVLSRISEEKSKIKQRVKHLPNYATKTYVLPVAKDTSRSSSNRNSTRSTSLTTSAIANEDFTSTSSTTDDTLSMISTPWSTETWLSQSADSQDSSYLSWISSEISSFTSSSFDPKSSSTFGIPSPDWKTDGNITETLLENVASSQSGSRYVMPLMRQRSGSTPTFSSWTLETYTSTGILSNSDRNAVIVNYPWSPNTFKSDTELTDYYPSTLTLNLKSQKGSREAFRYGRYEIMKSLTPMNIVKDDNPHLDWIKVKRNGIPIKK